MSHTSPLAQIPAVVGQDSKAYVLRIDGDRKIIEIIPCVVDAVLEDRDDENTTRAVVRVTGTQHTLAQGSTHTLHVGGTWSGDVTEFVVSRRAVSGVRGNAPLVWRRTVGYPTR